MKPQTWTLEPLDLTAIDAIAAGRPVRADSRLVGAGDVFLAFQGEYADGRTYIDKAIAAGAGAVLWESDNFTWQPEWTVPNLAVPQLRAQAGIVASHLLGDPSQTLFVAGVTGTNGKTSIAHWLGQAFSLLGNKTGVLGTMGNGVWGALEPSTHTTLDPIAVQQWLHQFREQGVSHVAMEVSSHGLAQARVHGVAFDTAVFTNLTRDHLDYHGSMEAYGAEKARLFAWEGLKNAVINVDDEFGRKLAEETTAKNVITYGIDQGDIRAVAVHASLAGLALEIDTPQGRCSVVSELIGRFNVYNLLATLGVLLSAGVSLTDAARALGQIKAAGGRMQRLGGGKQPLVVVDYAHTPDALEKALSTLRDAMPEGKRLYCVFGCGGDRDPGKRPIMGKIACDLADNVIVTSDNPRSESPQKIIEDIVKGVEGVYGLGDHNYAISVDRRHAIEDTIDLAGPDDVVLIAGKGHETYQEINGVRHHFDDVEEARAALERKSQ
ncbi:UDP-N-acetylmuramoyl-L-alanyl-D-glutamate--2,6-diaminopimelate ligase [Silvimonas amylolytica]|uniref:UDP-N-acetylmuramoyl-L-alanyl-D-glutamate--2,6-diaminopimelate ligase n=1 Tax=Silvimonas amylolytica TaxID=449663 RepID=A0ABQ2PJY0_9NEIS|nr:UDP-N-acetylmuramoyl-L-alanyl-D-glutamate--2,6-diaminopimelate ligase [Silvimonas amylolytica]GGP25658.1 UDP-N-acetylmuramoyl-L-alanyl-D-glutamate--2,6-diaminopimelate ligase [Silvimonas amylolytica]